MVQEFVKDFDSELRGAFDAVVGLVTSDSQWEQAAYPVKCSGLGFCRAADIADAAYMSSRAAVFEDCCALDGSHVWNDGPRRGGNDGEVIGEWLCGAVTQVNRELPEHDRFDFGVKLESECKQKDIMGRIYKLRRDAMLAAAGVWDKARLEATAAPHAGSWLHAPPSMAFDTQLTNEEVQYGVGRRLGSQLCEECPCPFCLGVMDRFGAHCESCMSGGDKTVNHNRVRDDLYQHGKRAHTVPQLEATGVIPLLGLDASRDTRERPADVLLCRGQDVITGVGNGSSRVALDIGIVCPQAAGHLGIAASEVLGAAEEYVRTKAARAEIGRRCREAGVIFQPVIFESLGGVSVEAERVIKSLNIAVASNTDTSTEVVATRFWQRVGVDMLRGNCRAFHRRLVGKVFGDAGAGDPFFGVSGLEVAGGF
jgi:hypothetical protein